MPSYAIVKVNHVKEETPIFVCTDTDILAFIPFFPSIPLDT